MNLPTENKMLMARNRIEMNSMHKLCNLLAVSILFHFSVFEVFFWRKRYFFSP